MISETSLGNITKSYEKSKQLSETSKKLSPLKMAKTDRDKKDEPYI